MSNTPAPPVPPNGAAAAPSDGPSRHDPDFVSRRTQNWVFLGLMYGFFYMSRYNLGAIKSHFCALFGLTDAQYGKIVFWGLLVYGVSVFLNGPLADKIGGKRALLIGSAGAAACNLLFGACYLFLGTPAVMKAGAVITPAGFERGMTLTTMIATFSALWAANNYFQSYGALSIVKVNAAWFHVSERGRFAGLFGVMIQGGRLLALWISPMLLSFLPWQFCFWLPAGILIGMHLAVRLTVEDSPAKAGLGEFDTGDESVAEAATPATLLFVLKKVFVTPTMWLIALSSICIGIVRHSIDQWANGYWTTMFAIDTKALKSFLPYNVSAIAIPVAAISGGLLAGYASDRIFSARRGPVILIAFIGQALCLFLFSQTLHSPWAGCVMLVAISFFIQSAHSMVGGAASMDFGGRKAVATAAGFFDGAQYLGGAFVSLGIGKLLDHYKSASHHEYDIWPLAPIPFAILGALLMSLLWNARPKRGGGH